MQYTFYPRKRRRDNMFNGILYILLTFKCGGRNMTYLGYRKHQI